MPQHIGNTGAETMAWAGRINLFLSSQTERGKGLGLLTHELTHVIQQTQPQRLLQRRLVKQDSSLITAALTTTPSDASTALPTPVENAPLTTGLQKKEAQVNTRAQLAAEGLTEQRSESRPVRNVEEVADRVYRLMQHDLILERERATKLGG